MLERYKDQAYIFVDIRPQLDIDIVQKGEELGWRAYTDYGMNARNDYTLLLEITKLIDESSLAFSTFKQLVAKVS